MTIALVINIPEGIILASDSQTTLSANVPVPCPGSAAVTFRTALNKFEQAQKIFEISHDDFRAGIIQFGIAHPGGRPLFSHIYTLRGIVETTGIQSLEECKKIISEHFEQFNAPSVQGLGFYLLGYDTANSDINFSGH